MKKFLLMLLVISLAILTTGCMTREKLTPYEFKANLEKKGFIVSDQTLTKSDQTITSYYVATTSEQKYNIEYYELNNEMTAQGIYLKYKEQMITTGAQVSTEVNLGNSEKYVDNYNGKYRVASRVANTVIWIDANIEYQEEIKSLLREIGY